MCVCVCVYISNKKKAVRKPIKLECSDTRKQSSIKSRNTITNIFITDAKFLMCHKTLESGNKRKIISLYI